MSTADEIPQLLTAAKANATTLEKSVPDTEAEIFDLVSTFEARMQHHFKRGPFFKKLRALMIENDQADLAASVHHYALAVNVLKHGTGASYRDLKTAGPLPFTLHIPAGNIRLVDVKEGGFYAGLIDTLEQAHSFLAGR